MPAPPRGRRRRIRFHASQVVGWGTQFGMGRIRRDMKVRTPWPGDHRASESTMGPPTASYTQWAPSPAASISEAVVTLKTYKTPLAPPPQLRHITALSSPRHKEWRLLVCLLRYLLLQGHGRIGGQRWLWDPWSWSFSSDRDHTYQVAPCSEPLTRGSAWCATGRKGRRSVRGLGFWTIVVRARGSRTSPVMKTLSTRGDSRREPS